MSAKSMNYYIIAFVLMLCIISVASYRNNKLYAFLPSAEQEAVDIKWIAPSVSQIPDGENGSLIHYGLQLITNTAAYLGPKGAVGIVSNGMNCQNCHLDAGTRLNANCFAAVAATYPKYKERSGRVESIEYRINDCMLRSLNGKPLDSTSREMKAMVAYINWVGKDVHKTNLPAGMGIPDMPLLHRAASAGNGKNIYASKCVSCHNADGQGLAQKDSSYIYPPLWGSHSYNVGAGMYRLTRLAGFIKQNMPYVAVQNKPQLSDEEAWDVAAYIIAQKRPVKMFAYDWKNIANKPVDYPFGPFADSFSIAQHQYGPYGEIKKWRQKIQGDSPAKTGK